jgi:glycosyltransferase involved in cell wall biosynthesis
LFQQTFEDIEYVFVNDCTPDDSIEKLQKVIEQYPNRKERIKIIHHEKNRGLAAARNTAVDNSTGKYIQHIDSDDWIELDMIETMYNKAEVEQADIVVCDFVFEKVSTKEIARAFVPKRREDYFICMLENTASYPVLWNKLVHRNLCKLSDCRSVEGLNIAEDWQVSIRWYYYAKKIVKTDEMFYHYDKTNINALTHSKTSMHYENIKLFYELLEQFLKEKGHYEKYINTIERLKVSSKVNKLIQTKDYSLIKKYAYLYRDIEMKYINHFRRGEKITLFLAHYKLYFPAHLFLKALRYKNRNIV